MNTGDKTVLILEDDAAVALDLKMGFEAAGISVMGPFGRTEEALEEIGRQSPDFAILDGKLHNDTSAEVATNLSARKVPFLYVTGHDSEFMRTNMPPAPVVAKPFDIGALIERVRGSLGGDDSVVTCG
jgi:DNA-binding response OmpR family regulator